MQAAPQTEKAAGQFAPYQPAAPGFERHTEPVRCAIWETYAAVLPLLLGLCTRNAVLCALPGLDQRLGDLGRLLFDHVLVTTGFCFCVVTAPAADYAVPLAVSVAVAALASAVAFACVLLRSRGRRGGGGRGGGSGGGGGSGWLPRELGEPAFDSVSGRARFVTEFRGLIYLPTCACILARDLPCFRLPFGKTRTFGTGVMDLGLGCFVFLMGLTAPSARSRQALASRADRLLALRRQAVLSLLLAACGLVRLALAPDQAVEEYGRDWNVFLSLAAVKLVGSATELLALPALAGVWRGADGAGPPPALLACGLLVAYEGALGPGGLALAIVRPEEAAEAEAAPAWSPLVLAHASRRGQNFLTANRDGLAACVGLYCLYLLALQFGRLALPLLAGRGAAAVGRFIGWCGVLAAAMLGLHALPYAGLALPESRRLANLAYAAWILGFCSAYLAACALVSCLFHALAGRRQNHRCDPEPPPPATSPLLLLIDSHGLAYFLIGNLLTGVTGRWLLPAIYGRRDFGRAMPQWACVPVLAGYMLALTLATCWILPKLWSLGYRLLKALPPLPEQPPPPQLPTPPSLPQPQVQLQTISCV